MLNLRLQDFDIDAGFKLEHKTRLWQERQDGYQ